MLGKAQDRLRLGRLRGPGPPLIVISVYLLAQRGRSASDNLILIGANSFLGVTSSQTTTQAD